jgi:hypothetical protein
MMSGTMAATTNTKRNVFFCDGSSDFCEACAAMACISVPTQTLMLPSAASSSSFSNDKDFHLVAVANSPSLW